VKFWSAVFPLATRDSNFHVLVPESAANKVVAGANGAQGQQVYYYYMYVTIAAYLNEFQFLE
jgi:hypothetical protein